MKWSRLEEYPIWSADIGKREKERDYPDRYIFLKRNGCVQCSRFSSRKSNLKVAWKYTFHCKSIIYQCWRYCIVKNMLLKKNVIAVMWRKLHLSFLMTFYDYKLLLFLILFRFIIDRTDMNVKVINMFFFRYIYIFFSNVQ